jgi:transcription-repair coupling factor (superfamily II helicase)
LDRSGAYVSECTLETDLEMLIPDQYVSQVAERMSLYRNLNEIKTEEQLSAFSKQLSDRFGKIPRQIYDLFDGLRLKWVAVQLGMEKVVLNKRHLRCYFPENQQSVFYSSDLFARILEMVRTQRKGIYLRQTEKHLILHAEGIGSMHTAMQQLSEWQRLIGGNAGADKIEISQ